LLEKLRPARLRWATEEIGRIERHENVPGNLVGARGFVEYEKKSRGNRQETIAQNELRYSRNFTAQNALALAEAYLIDAGCFDVREVADKEKIVRRLEQVLAAYDRLQTGGPALTAEEAALRIAAEAALGRLRGK